MLKLILIFKSGLCSQTFLGRRHRFISIETTVYLFFKNYPVQSKLGQRCFLKKELCMSYMVFLHKSGPIDAMLIMQNSFIAKKFDIEDEDFLLMIPELQTSAVSCFGIKVVTENITLFQFSIYFRILLLFNQKKVIPLSYHLEAPFLNKSNKQLHQ